MKKNISNKIAKIEAEEAPLANILLVAGKQQSGDMEEEEKKKPFNHNGQFYCPLCSSYHKQSTYLASAIPDLHVRYVANMVTHYRHNHITSWNKCWGPNGHLYRGWWFGEYDEEKAKVNERAKRQIIRKATEYLIHFGFTPSVFKMLEGSAPKTLELAEKKLGEVPQKESRPKKSSNYLTMVAGNDNQSTLSDLNACAA